jgi:hypothetical protein
MGTSAIAFSSADVTALQDDVNELNTKLNAIIAAYNISESSSLATASVTGLYGTGGSVVTLGNKGEVRAKKLARQTLNRLRK